MFPCRLICLLLAGVARVIMLSDIVAILPPDKPGSQYSVIIIIIILMSTCPVLVSFRKPVQSFTKEVENVKTWPKVSLVSILPIIQDLQLCCVAAIVTIHGQALHHGNTPDGENGGEHQQRQQQRIIKLQI